MKNRLRNFIQKHHKALVGLSWKNEYSKPLKIKMQKYSLKYWDGIEMRIWRI